MNSNNLIIFPFIFFFLNTSPHFSVTDVNFTKTKDYSIYFIKQGWHTAIVFNTQDLYPDIFLEYEYFNQFSLIDIGWGDEEFYQYPGFDSGLAFKALFYATSSTLRVEGVNLTKDEYFNLSEIVIEVEITKEQLIKICDFINNSFLLDDNNKSIILSEKAGGKIIFYKAKDSYHLFNTCNTWLAKCLNQAGINIEDNIILTEQLFNELSTIGQIIRANYPSE